jgi:UDP-3-O-[3-hydroxymyristoyl] glucosamine N-acyltransferase
MSSQASNPGRHRGVSLPTSTTLEQLVHLHGGQLDPEVAFRTVDAIAVPDDADSRCIVPVLSRRVLAKVRELDAPLLIDASIRDESLCGRRWVHPHARWVLAALLESIHPPPQTSQHPTAIIDPSAQLGENVDVGPYAVIFPNAVVGDRCRIGPHAVIYGAVRLGNDVVVGAGAVVGRPGFGWAFGPAGQVRRMPHLGGVVIDDDVEIGPLVTIDAGTLSATHVARGAKLDAHVHVGHNVQIGSGTLVAAQAGFAGSARIGQGVLVGGQAGVADHVVVGERARLAAKAGVIGDVPPATTVAGYPAVERIRWLRAVARGMRG